MAPKKAKSKSGSKASKKKAGPKGKKARAKAKLDRQWGEQPVVVESRDNAASRRRTRTSRIGSTGEESNVQDPLATADPSDRQFRSRSSSAREAPAISDHAFRPDMDSRSRRRRFGHSDDDEYDNSDSDDHSSDDDNEHEEPAATMLLQSLRDHHRRSHKKRKRQGSARGAIDDDDDDDDSERSDDDDSDNGGQEKDENAMEDPDEDPMSTEQGALHQMVVIEDPFAGRFMEHVEPLSEPLIKEPSLETISGRTDPGLVFQASSNLLDRLGIVRAPKQDGGKDVPSLEVQGQALARSLVSQLSAPLRTGWQRWCQSSAAKKKTRVLPNPMLYPFVATYADCLIANDSTQATRDSTLATMALHVLNHVHKTQEVIRRNNHTLYHQKSTRSGDPESNNDHDEYEDVVDPPRDQGFTRPTVLVLLPTRSCCYQLVQLLQSMLGQQPQNANTADPAMERFEAEYGPPPAPDEDVAAAEKEQLLQRRKQILRQKGSDWQELFGDDANDDDDFKLGIALHKNRAVKNASSDASNSAIRLFTDFYKSDIILASPLGLKILLENKDDGADENDEDGDDEDDEQAGDGKRHGKNQRGYDFLSSIEICYISRADVLLMQNWDHVCDVVRILNEQPKCSTAIDFARVRPYHLVAGQALHWRQIIVTSSFVDPMILSLFKLHAKSSAGSVRLRRRTADVSDAAIARVLLPTRQVFQRVPTQSLAEHAADRVRYFCDTVLPEIERQRQKHTLVFVPSYFDFVSVRNVMLKREIDFVSVTEYSRVSEVSRGRARFLQGRKSIMLYTGRAHFFHRHAIKGARHLVFVGVPEYAEFYSGLVNMLGEGLENDKKDAAASSLEASCLVLLTKYDGHALERIVGLPNCSRMLRGEKSTFLF